MEVTWPHSCCWMASGMEPSSQKNQIRNKWRLTGSRCWIERPPFAFSAKILRHCWCRLLFCQKTTQLQCLILWFSVLTDHLTASKHVNAETGRQYDNLLQGLFEWYSSWENDRIGANSSPVHPVSCLSSPFFSVSRGSPDPPWSAQTTARSLKTRFFSSWFSVSSVAVISPALLSAA